MASAGRGFLYNPKVQKLLKGFVVCSAEHALPDHPEIGHLVKKLGGAAKNNLSEVLGSQGAGNVYFIILDPQGNIVHYWGLTKVEELAKGVAKLKTPPPPVDESKTKLTLPDLCPCDDPRFPAGLRLYIRAKGAQGWNANSMTIVQPVPLKTDAWKALSMPVEAKDIDAELFKDAVVEIFPGAIRAASSPRAPGFTAKLPGKLKLEPAGSDKKFRYAVVRGPVQLYYGGRNISVNNSPEPKFKGTIKMVLKYRRNTAEVHSCRGVIEGDYRYQPGPKGTFRMTAAVESRPE